MGWMAARKLNPEPYRRAGGKAGYSMRRRRREAQAPLPGEIRTEKARELLLVKACFRRAPDGAMRDRHGRGAGKRELP